MNARGKETVISDERFSIRESDVHGYGMFANEYIPEGDTVGVWLTKDPKKCGLRLYKGWNETCTFGRFCNHSDTPNVSLKLDESSPKEAILKSNGIKAGEEIFVDYQWAYELTGFKSDLLE